MIPSRRPKRQKRCTSQVQLPWEGNHGGARAFVGVSNGFRLGVFLSVPAQVQGLGQVQGGFEISLYNKGASI